MVEITDHRFAVRNFTYTPRAGNAFYTPTVFSGLAVKYGAGSCTDHPGPATLTARVFLPESCTPFYPSLNDPVSYSIGGTGGNASVFRGRIDALTIDDVDGTTPPARIPNSRNLTSLTGWNFYTSAFGVPEVTSTAALTSSPHRVKAIAAALATTQPKSVRILAPATPVVPGQFYAVTAHAQAAFSGPTIAVQWYASGLPSAPMISSSYAPVEYFGSTNNSWFGITTDLVQAPAGALFARASISITPVDSRPDAGAVLLDTINLITAPERKSRPAGRWVTLQASDVTASAARLMIGDEPWRAEPATYRILRLSELVPREVFTFQSDQVDTTLLAYRDIDNQSALAAFQRIARSLGSVAIASPQFETLITTAPPARSSRSLQMVAGTPQLLDDPALVKIPAGSIRKGSFSTSITGLSNTVKFNYRTATEGGSEDAAETIQNAGSIAAYGPMARTIDTDLPAAEGKAWDQAQRIVTNQAQPVYRLSDSTNILLNRLPDTAPSWDIFNMVTGFRRLVHVPDAPALIGNYHRIHAASMVFGRDPALALDMEPASMLPNDSITFQELRAAPYTGVTFAKFTHLTFVDLAQASRAIIF